MAVSRNRSKEFGNQHTQACTHCCSHLQMGPQQNSSAVHVLTMYWKSAEHST